MRRKLYVGQVNFFLNAGELSLQDTVLCAGRCEHESRLHHTSVKTSVSEARLRWLTELIFQIGHSVGILECQRRPPGLQMYLTT